ncbi:MAG: L-histidine N(alpha)-methyltransferase [Sporichthyaceae bacterium]
MTCTESRLQIDVHLPPDFAEAALRADVLAGLGERPLTLPPKWFYDKVGSDLFTEITRLPEYYPTRAEREILAREADRIAAASGATTVVELGSGSSEKTRLLLDALTRAGTLRRYVGLDVSADALLEAANGLLTEYPDLEVHGLVADFEHQLDLLPRAEGKRLVVFLGGTVGNFEPEARARFLRGIAESLRPGDHLLLGTDLVKSPAVLVPAYDDAAGVTAKFNKNVLAVINRELDADFDVDAFAHVALWNAEAEWIEMRLRANGPQHVHVRALDLHLDIADGEEIHTEISAKFRPDGIRTELAAAGLTLRKLWTDSQGRFGLSLSGPDRE